MPELTLCALPPRGELRAALRRRVASLDPPLRVLAEDIAGESGRIDLLAVDPDGRVVVLLLGEAGQDLALFTRALGTCEWLGPRLADWSQLAPGLSLQADAPVRGLVLCPSFQPETLTASRGAGGESIDLALVRAIRNGADAVILIEPLAPKPAPPQAAEVPEATAEAVGAELPRFRTGLSERDLDLSSDELRELQ